MCLLITRPHHITKYYSENNCYWVLNSSMHFCQHFVFYTLPLKAMPWTQVYVKDLFTDCSGILKVIGTENILVTDIGQVGWGQYLVIYTFRIILWTAMALQTSCLVLQVFKVAFQKLLILISYNLASPVSRLFKDAQIFEGFRLSLLMTILHVTIWARSEGVTTCFVVCSHYAVTSAILHLPPNCGLGAVYVNQDPNGWRWCHLNPLLG